MTQNYKVEYIFVITEVTFGLYSHSFLKTPLHLDGNICFCEIQNSDNLIEIFCPVEATYDKFSSPYHKLHHGLQAKRSTFVTRIMLLGRATLAEAGTVRLLHGEGGGLYSLWITGGS